MNEVTMRDEIKAYDAANHPSLPTILALNERGVSVVFATTNWVPVFALNDQIVKTTNCYLQQGDCILHRRDNDTWLHWATIPRKNGNIIPGRSPFGKPGLVIIDPACTPDTCHPLALLDWQHHAKQRLAAYRADPQSVKV